MHNLQSPALKKSKLIYPAGIQPPPSQQQECNEVSQAELLASLWAASGSGNWARVQPSNNQHSRGGPLPAVTLVYYCLFSVPFTASPPRG